MRYILLFLLMCTQVFALAPTEVAVVYNADSALSKAAAMRYCEVRGIPSDQLLPLFGVKRGDISREDYEGFIMNSLLMQGRKRGLRWPAGPNNGFKLMRAMVLMPDIPLRVKEQMRDGKPVGQGQKRTEAAVDSELALLGARYPTAGMGRNPHYDKKMPSGREPQKILSVCRIDGPDEATVFRMINEPAEVEKMGLSGWVVVDNGGPYKEGNAMMDGVIKLARKYYLPLFTETSRQTLADSFPLMQDVATYFGWYANPANGPFHAKAPSDFRFARGAIACHLHSFSGTSLYDGRSWVSALLKRGACVTAGNVAEPYLGPCLNYAVFYRQLLAGAQVGEAALLASPTVSWQCIVLGDPLYRPFARWNRTGAPAAWQELCRRFGHNPTALQNAVEQQLGRPYGATLAEMYALHCADNGQPAAAAGYLEAAAQMYGRERDKMRCRLLMFAALAAGGERERAESGVTRLLNESAASPYLPAIRKSAEAIIPKKEAPAQAKEPQKK
ncbi:MAG: TIGR03790 family protein [Akkermansia sp.]|nr:TIGR03790 family protein [Akkermansia sp.]